MRDPSSSLEDRGQRALPEFGTHPMNHHVVPVEMKENATCCPVPKRQTTGDAVLPKSLGERSMQTETPSDVSIMENSRICATCGCAAATSRYFWHVWFSAVESLLGLKQVEKCTHSAQEPFITTTSRRGKERHPRPSGSLFRTATGPLYVPRTTKRITAKLWLLILALSWFPCVVVALTPCSDGDICRTKLHPNSECLSTGYCSNPFYKGGCLANYYYNNYETDEQSLPPQTRKKRICHSEDPDNALEEGHCMWPESSLLQYPEVRIVSQNWESAIFSAWILQILLVEFLQVPATIETGIPQGRMDFYDPHMAMDYGEGNDWKSLKTSVQYQDCRLANSKTRKLRNPQRNRNVDEEDEQSNEEDSDYQSCGHVIPEVWNGHYLTLRELHDNNTIEAPTGLGALGGQGWFIPKHMAANDTSFTTYLGLQGPTNRHKLAAALPRPTSWKEYCEEESPDQCETPSEVATRAPATKEEGKMYFLEGTFRGYFRNTTENDCETWSDNCTGHIVDFPCGWSSFVTQQTYHLDIGLQSSGPQDPIARGYTYQQMTQIWAAANATKSNVLLHWWTPEALYQQYIGTDMEMHRVSLPPPTQECVNHQAKPVDRCNGNLSVQIGDSRGACDEQFQALLKVIGTSLFQQSNPPDQPSALHSPAYRAVKNFLINDLQYGELFTTWLNRSSDPTYRDEKYSFNTRHAVCTWVVENYDYLGAFVPRSYPRMVVDSRDEEWDPLVVAAMTAACVATFLTLVFGWVTFLYRKKIRNVSIEFLTLLLVGLLLVSVGAFMTAVQPPTNAICVSIIWLINYGYTLELVPLVVRMAAISRLYLAAQNLRRITVQKSSLFGAVLVIAIIVGLSLTAWTALDPPRKKSEAQLTDDEFTASTNGENENGRGEQSYTIIEQTYYCGQDADFWNLLEASWQALLLLCASILAFQTRKVRSDVVEVRTLATLIYSLFVFAVIRTITHVLELNKADLAAARSLISSCDVIATLVIYFLPKFMAGAPRPSFHHNLINYPFLTRGTPSKTEPEYDHEAVVAPDQQPPGSEHCSPSEDQRDDSSSLEGVIQSRFGGSLQTPVLTQQLPLSTASSAEGMEPTTAYPTGDAGEASLPTTAGSSHPQPDFLGANTINSTPSDEPHSALAIKEHPSAEFVKDHPSSAELTSSTTDT